MPELNLEQLNALLDDHFAVAPPLGNPNIIRNPDGTTTAPIVQGSEVRQFGIGASLGDGTSKSGLHGLENIQVFSPNDREPISLKAWMEQAIDKKTAPDKIAGDVSKLLQNGQLAYLEQGREFVTRLRLNEQNNLETNPVNNAAPAPEKPELTFGQKILHAFGLFGFFQKDEREQYDRKMVDYELYRQSLAGSAVRKANEKIALTANAEDGKGFVNGENFETARELNGLIAAREQNKKLPLETQRLNAYTAILKTEKNPQRQQSLQEKIEPLMAPKYQTELEAHLNESGIVREYLDLRYGAGGSKSPEAKAREQKTLDMMYQNKRPPEIKNFSDHCKSKIDLQNNLPHMKYTKYSEDQELVERNRGTIMTPKDYFLKALVGIIGPENYRDTPSQPAKYPNETKLTWTIGASAAFQKTVKDENLLAKKLAANEMIDEFARNFERDPFDGIAPQGLKNLLNLCIEPHPLLDKVANLSNPQAKAISKEVAATRKEMLADLSKPLSKPQPKMGQPK